MPGRPTAVDPDGPPNADDPDGSSSAVDMREPGAWSSVRRWIVDERAVLVLLAAVFVGRWWLAGWRSYWLDELLSVNVYGRWHDTAVDALRHLASESVHPPLYQFLLYRWMELFGDSELATRTLSNLFITLTALVLYLLMRQAFGRRIALTSTVAFSVSYTATAFGLETRSYAQTMFLVTLSSYLLLWLLDRLASDPRWRTVPVALAGIGLVGANTALLMTHYYNLFWLAGQGLVALVYVLRQWPPSRWAAGAGGLAAIYLVPAALFWVTWGGVFTNQLDDLSGGFELEGDAPRFTAVDLLVDLVIRQNLDPATLVTWIGLGLGAVLLVWAVVTVLPPGPVTEHRRQAWTVLYLAGWLALPLVVTSVAFSVLGVERYTARYFVFSAVPVTPLLVLLVETAVRGVARVVPRRVPRGAIAAAAVGLCGVVVVTLVLPLGQVAATESHYDWAGIARRVDDVIQADDEHRYVVYETSHLEVPMIDHYLDQLPGGATVSGTVRPTEEGRGSARVLEEDRRSVEEHDRLVVTFAHLRTSSFRGILEQLAERYPVRHRQLTGGGHGFIVYDVNGSPDG